MTSKKESAVIAYNATLTYSFLFLLFFILMVTVLWILKPFLIDIILAGVIASFFYPIFKKINTVLHHSVLSSFITTLLIAAVVIIPLVQFFIYLLHRTMNAYTAFLPYLQDPTILSRMFEYINNRVAFLGFNTDQLVGIIIDASTHINMVLLNLSTGIVLGTTSFIVNTLIIFLTIFYLFIDGKKIARRFMNLTPLPNKYDVKIFKTFREISYSTIMSQVVVGLFQGIVGGIGFMFAGLPGFFPGILMGASAILPYFGAAIIWIPGVIYLLSQHLFTGAIILTLFGLVVSFGDNLLRAYVIKGKSRIHEILVFFSLIGGLLAFGFWGFIIGPLILALFFTIIEIYEEEFAPSLEVEMD